MKKYLLLLFYLPLLSFSQANSIEFQAPQSYHLIIEGFDWGPAANKVVIKMNQPVKEVNASDFEIYVNRSSDMGEIPAGQRAGKRSVILGYPSDESGNRLGEGWYATLVLAVSPVMPLGSPIQYMRAGNRGGNFWIDYQMTILDTNQSLR